MEVVYQGYLEMIKAWYDNAEQRREAKKQMEYGGWIVYDEYLNDKHKVVVTYIRPINFEGDD